MKLAKFAKLANPAILVIAGGPHVPNDPQNFFSEHPYVDVLIHGEGEITFARILQRIIFNADIEARGYSTADHFSELSLFGPKLPKDIPISSPYQRGFLNASIAEAHERGLEFWVPWETNRGCPYQCSFCDWGSSLMNKVRRFDMERIADDITFFGERQIENVYICDANFGMLARDENITKELVTTKNLTGYPKQIRGSFAKNSNNRVFNITSDLMKAGMIYGTTLSMQSTDKKVLESVARSNIGIEKYQQLQERYRTEGYHTYTELILALPTETKESFIHGIDELLIAGNHEDIRVWELSILPNAPMAQQMDEFGLETITKNVFLELPKTPVDEIETNEIVVSTNTMSREEWVDCYLFAWVVQALHCGGYTRYVATYLWNTHKIPYRRFYEQLIDSCMKLDDCKFGKALRDLRDLLYLYADDPKTTLLQKINGYPGRYYPADWLWLTLCDNKPIFYKRLLRIVIQVTDDSYGVISNLITFQREIMLDPSYDPTDGKVFAAYDWHQYFESGTLEKRIYSHTVSTTNTGVDDKYLLIKDDKKAFANAAVGAGFLISRHHHYTHHAIVVSDE
jgi:putative methyltransferase